MPKTYLLEHRSPGRATTRREYKTFSEAIRTMQAEYFDELANDAHAANADERNHIFSICSHEALIRWRKGYVYRWIITTKH